MTWRKRRDRKGPFVQWSERLSNGRVLSLSFSVNNWQAGQTVILPHLIVHRPFMRRHTWRYAGLPTGAPGVETFARVMELWDSGIDAALALTKRPYVEIQVTAETPRLFAIYINRLTPHGYRFQPGQTGIAESYLWKTLRSPHLID